ncbi:MAG: hypothetical protein GXX96_35990 [Planctomycetaceae bacterium]|nr:hypothetical protein [Planctomycetaceae bacterium]
MPNGDEPTPDELFHFVMSRLTRLQAADLVRQIERSIARGVVTSVPGETYSVLRPMTDLEKLSVSLEYVVTAFDTPAMLARCRELLQCSEITWTVEVDGDDIDLPSSSLDNKHDVSAVKKLISIIDEMQLPIPEIP